MPSTIPVEHIDPINAQILAISEDLIAGFQRQPFHLIAEKSGVPLETVLVRIRAMQEAGVVRRVRQTLLSTKLAHGALVAWKVPPRRIRFPATSSSAPPTRMFPAPATGFGRR
jgi:DNA-binding Lrp family transcriptional regulator